MLKVEDQISMRMRGKIVMKRIGVIGLLLVILFQLCSCNGNNGGKQENETDASTETEAISEADKEVTSGIPVIDTALRAYFRLTDEEPLTKEMLEAVTSLRISATSYTCQKEGYTLVSVRVNGKNEFGGVLELTVDADRFEAFIAKFTNENSKRKFCAYYVKRDPDDPTLWEKTRQEMLTRFPECANGAIYLLDPTISMRNYAQLLEILERNDLLESKCIEGAVLNGALLNRLPNLTTVTLRGIEVENLPENVTVIREEYTKYDLQDRFKLDNTPMESILTIE